MSKNYYANRELSFLKFNKRVLAQALNENMPIFERFKFISIFHSNLDEFYMIRAGTLYEKSLLKDNARFSDNKTGWSPERQLKEIFRETKGLCREADAVFAQVSGLLAENGLARVNFNGLDGNEKKWLKRYFKREIMPLLSPQIIDSKHPFPHLLEKQIYISLELLHEGKRSYGIISQNTGVARIVQLPGEGFRYMLAEDVIYSYAKELFKKHRILAKFIIRVTRNADLNAEEELEELYDEDGDELDFRSHMDKVLKKRGKLAPVRLQISGRGRLRRTKEYLCERLNIKDEQAFITDAPLDMSFIFALEAKAGAHLLHAPINPVMPDNIGESVMRAVEGRDIFLHYPRHSIKAYIRLLEECVSDPDVLSVKITLYRLSANSQVIDCLCRLAEAGKQVAAVVELAARFDEENNINWSKRLEESGCALVYGVEGYKVHSKLTLITRKRGGAISYITHFATGNYNEKTARLYTDVGIITGDRAIGEDALKFFNSVATATPADDYALMLVAPLRYKSEIIKFIGEQAEKGAGGRIRMKLNSLSDRDIIDALAAASQAGARVRLIVRGICCLVPGVEGSTANISVRSVVGRFLEHSRVFIFGQDGESRVYLSSADLMTRSTTRRFEAAVPVLDGRIRRELEQIFDLYWREDARAQHILFE